MGVWGFYLCGLLVGGVVVAGDVVEGAGDAGGEDGVGDAVGYCGAGGANNEGGVTDGTGVHDVPVRVLCDSGAGDVGGEGGVGTCQLMVRFAGQPAMVLPIVWVAMAPLVLLVMLTVRVVVLFAMARLLLVT